MNTRKNFDSNLNSLKEKLLDMAEKSQQAVKLAMEAFLEQNIEKAEQVTKQDAAIDKLDVDINNQAILLIAREAPVATDLRKIIVALRISTEVERIGDMAVNIAKSTLHVGQETSSIKEVSEISKMLNIAMEMYTDSLTAYYTEDVHIAKDCADKDDLVDELYGKIIKDLFHYIPTHPSATNQIMQLAFICRFIERIADHVTNISENVIYLATGKTLSLNE
ncbi:phosphate signaling complex protein PhoU [Bacillaceae bacterium Marseille-Q3522]|nr:phosphate signaling complex protein PhoU [Bacillaceae bacterium Marseille-Q3522]